MIVVQGMLARKSCVTRESCNTILLLFVHDENSLFHNFSTVYALMSDMF